MSSKNSEVREETLLTPLKVAQKTAFLEWGSQPSRFKHYPDFCYRIPFNDVSTLSWLTSVRCVTSKHRIAAKPYYQMNVPSAGNLHPIELYGQIRNVAGVLDGIYHLDGVHEELVLIQEIEGDGIERYVGMENRFNGCILMVSLVPFRSFWKYSLRSWRYGYLDLGHQIGALCGALRHFGLETTKMSQMDGRLLNSAMGMGEDEFITAVYAVGETGGRSAQLLKTPLMRVSPCDYTYRDTRLNDAIQGVPVYSAEWDTAGFAVDDFEQLNRTRRSAREFYPPAAEDGSLRIIMDLPAPDTLEIVSVVLQAQSMQCGAYRNGLCLQEADYRNAIVHLLLEQRFIANASMAVLIYGRCFDAHTHIEAGIFAHKLYLLSESMGMGCSGIGAFYDEEGSQWSENPLLYAVAIGGKN